MTTSGTMAPPYSTVIALKDNLPHQPLGGVLEPDHAALLEKYSGKTLGEFASLGIQTIPPQAASAADDQTGRDDPVYRFNRDDNTIDAGNCMGIAQFHDTGTNAAVRLQIKSRFDNGPGQPFLLYLLSKVFGGTLLDTEIPSDDNALWDVILALMFRQKFRDACAAGLFRQYRLDRHNDMRYRGTFDISRHLNTNIPFTGAIAYNTRDISYDNPLNHLLRHTLNKTARKWPWLWSAETNDVNALRDQIAQNTPTWNPNGVYSCVMNNRNRTPVRHPLYAQYYEPLRSLSLALLHDDGASPYDAQDDEAQGFLFDGAWLWEEYIAALFNEKCKELGIHHQTHTDSLFTDDGIKAGQGIIPDFISRKRGTKSASFIGDTKYKHFERKSSGEARGDYFQIITYMYRYNCRKGILIFPYDGGDDNKETFLDGYAREIDNDGEDRSYVIELGLEIPRDKPDFESFQKAMEASEDRFIDRIRNQYAKQSH